MFELIAGASFPLQASHAVLLWMAASCSAAEIATRISAGGLLSQDGAEPGAELFLVPMDLGTVLERLFQPVET